MKNDQKLVKQHHNITITASPKPPFDLMGKIKLQLHTFLPMMSWKCMLTAWSTDCSASKVINPKPSQRPRVNQGSGGEGGVVTTQDEEQYWASAEWGPVKTEQEAPGVRMMSHTYTATQTKTNFKKAAGDCVHGAERRHRVVFHVKQRFYFITFNCKQKQD